MAELGCLASIPLSKFCYKKQKGKKGEKGRKEKREARKKEGKKKGRQEKKKNIHTLDNDSTGMGSTSEGVGLQPGPQVSLLVLFVSPTVDTAVSSQLACRSDSLGLTHVEIEKREKRRRGKRRTGQRGGPGSAVHDVIF